MTNLNLSACGAIISSTVFLAACAMQPVEVPPASGAVSYLDQAAVTAYVTGNTEEFSKGAGYYADDGNLLIRWDNKDLTGTYVIREDGQLCMVVAEWGGGEDCQQYADVDGEVMRFYEGRPRNSVMIEGNALDAY